MDAHERLLMDSSAFLSFVRTLTPVEKSAVLDALSSYTERVADDEPQPRHHPFLKSLQAIVEEVILSG